MKNVKDLEKAANTLRKHIIEMSHSCGRAAHPGPALSCADIVAALYFGFMDIDPQTPEKPDRDRLILSKGHACPAIYAALCELGYFSSEAYSRLRHPDAILQGHPTYGKTPGVDMTTGSLGNGLGIGLGMAWYLKLKGFKSRVFVILGDGELNEGTVWESAMYAPVAKVDNLIVYVDDNGFQSSGASADILPLPRLRERWEAFGWNALEIDGHSMDMIVEATREALAPSGRPTVIIAKTIKGKGVSFMENNNAWHQSVLTRQQYDLAMSELEGGLT